MNAEEARKITAKALRHTLSVPLVKMAHKRIEEAARKGKRIVYYPFYGVDVDYDLDCEKAAIAVLEEEGYDCEHVTSPPSDDPREGGSYWEVRW